MKHTETLARRQMKKKVLSVLRTLFSFGSLVMLFVFAVAVSD